MYNISVSVCEILYLGSIPWWLLIFPRLSMNINMILVGHKDVANECCFL